MYFSIGDSHRQMNLCYHFHVRHSCRFGSRCRFVHEFRFNPAKTYYMTHRPITNAYARTLDRKFEMMSWVLGIDCHVIEYEYAEDNVTEHMSERFESFRTVPKPGFADITVARDYVKEFSFYSPYGSVRYGVIHVERFMGFPKSLWKHPSNQVLALEPVLCADLMRRVFDLIPRI